MQKSLTLVHTNAMPKRIRPRQDLVTNNGQLTAHLVAEDIGWAAFPALQLNPLLMRAVLPMHSHNGPSQALRFMRSIQREQHPLAMQRDLFLILRAASKATDLSFTCQAFDSTVSPFS